MPKTSSIYLIPALTFLLFAGQGFRNALGLWGYGLFCLAAMAWSWYECRGSFKMNRVPRLLISFLLVAAATVLWTSYPTEAMFGLAVLAATTTAALLVAQRFSPLQILTGVWYGLLATVAFSLAFEFLVALTGRPLYALFDELSRLAGMEGTSLWSSGLILEGGPIQGLMANRNLLGFAAVLLCILSYIRLRMNEGPYWLAAVGLGLGVVAHLLTGSATITVIMFGLAFIAMTELALHRMPDHWKPFGLLGAFAAAGIAAQLIAANIDRIFSLLDRDPDFTSRTTIWERVMDLALLKPEGWGWVGYWPVWEEPYRGLFTSPDGTPQAHAHNAFLDILLQTGIVGLAVFLLLASATVMASAWQVYSAPRAARAIPLAIFMVTLALLVQGLTESRLLLEGNWFLFVLCATWASSLLRERFSGSLERLSGVMSSRREEAH